MNKNDDAPRAATPGMRHSGRAYRFAPTTKFYGTGSYPRPPHGLQRHTRLVAKYTPLNAPCRCNASTAYREQLGSYRHTGPITAPNVFWYTRIKKMKTPLITSVGPFLLVHKVAPVQRSSTGEKH